MKNNKLDIQTELQNNVNIATKEWLGVGKNAHLITSCSTQRLNRHLIISYSSSVEKGSLLF